MPKSKAIEHWPNLTKPPVTLPERSKDLRFAEGDNVGAAVTVHVCEPSWVSTDLPPPSAIPQPVEHGLDLTKRAITLSECNKDLSTAEANDVSPIISIHVSNQPRMTVCLPPTSLETKVFDKRHHAAQSSKKIKTGLDVLVPNAEVTEVTEIKSNERVIYFVIGNLG